MKILFVSELYPSDEKPQYCIFIEQQAQALRELGNDVDVLRLKRSENVNQSLRMESVRNGLRIFCWEYFSSKRDELLMTPLKRDLIKSFLLKENYHVISLHIGSTRPFKAIANVCKGNSTKVFAHFHGLNVWRDYYQSTKQAIVRSYKNLHRMALLNRIDGAIGVSDCTCQKIRLHYHGPVFTVYNGVDLTRFVGMKNVDTEVFRILCVANLIPLKGQSYLIQAVAKVIKQGHRVELVLVGEGPERERLQNMCAQLGIDNAVHFLGVLPYDDVARQMALSDIFIMPSHFEAFGCVYVEAMATGTLTCGCRLYGAAEIINDRTDGLLFEEKNVDAIVDTITYAIENPEEAQRMAENGIQKAAVFSWRKSAESLEKVYRGALHSGL